MENLIQLAVSGQVIEISGQAFIRNEEGELVPLELQQGLIGGTEVVLIDDAYIRVASDNGDEIIYDVDNADGFLYNSGLSDDLAQEVADIQDLVESDEDGELELEATAAGQGGQGGGQGAAVIDNSDQETIASSRYDTNLEASQAGQGAPEDDNQDVVQSDPDEQDPTAPQAQDNNPPEEQQTDTAPQTQDDTASTPEDNSVAINVLDNDTDAEGDDLTLTEAVAENGTVEINEDGTIVYNPNQDFNGTDTVSYTVTDTNGNSSVGTVTINISPVDDPTVIQQNPPTTLQADDTDASGQVIASDADDPDLSVVPNTIVGSSGEFTIDENGNWTYTINEESAAALAEGEVQTETFTVELTNGVTTDVVINVNGTDDLPVVSLGAGTVTEDSVTSVSGQLTAEDPDNPDLAFVEVNTAGAYGDLVVDADGNWTYTLNENAEVLQDGDQQVETFVVSLNDGTTTEINVTVEGSGGQATIVQDETTPTTGEVIIENPSSPDVTTVAVSQDGDYGTLTVDENGNWTFVVSENARELAEGETASEVFQVPLSDGTTVEVVIDIRGTDDEPVISQGEANVTEDTNPTDSGTLTATDVDNPDLAFVAETVVGTYGELVVDADGNWTFTAGPNAQGLAEGEQQSEVYTVSLNDGSTTTVTVNLTGTDDAPVISTGSGSVIEDTQPTATGQLTANDVDNPDLAFVVTNQAGAYGDLSVDADGNWVYQANNSSQALVDGEVQVETFTVALNDGSTTSIEVTITGTDEAPVISADVANITEDTNPTASGTLTASDADNPDLEFVAETVTGTYGELVVDADGNWTFTAGANAQTLAGGEQQTEVYTVSLNDGSTTTVTVNLTGTDDAPVIGTSSGSVVEDTQPSVSGTVDASDVDNPDLAFNAGQQSGTYGQLTIDGDGNWTYVLDETASNSLQGGEQATETFTVSLNDGNSTTIEVSITGTDDQPVISAGVATVSEDDLVVSGQLTVTDPDGPGLTFVPAVQAGTYGELTVDADGNWQYQPNANAQTLPAGAQQDEIFTVTLSDGSTTSVTVSVTGADDAPVISTATAAVTEDSSPSASGQLTATDVDNPGLTFVAETVTGQYGEVVVDADGNWTFTAGPGAQELAGGEQATEVYTITLSDGSQTSISVDFTGTDDSPVISPSVASFTEDSAADVSGQISFSDTDNPNLEVNAGTQNGVYGDLVVNAQGEWTYTPNANMQSLQGGEQQTDVFTVTFNDGSTTTVQLDLTGTDDAPVISSATANITEDVTTTASGTLTATDADNPSLAFNATTQNGAYGDLVVDADGNWTYTQNAGADSLADGEQQVETFTVNLNDGSATTITVNVTGTDDAPVVTSGTGSVVEDTTPTASGQLSATDADNPGLAFVAGTTSGTYGEITVDETGAWTFTAGPGAQALAGGEVQTEVYTLTLNDGTTTTVSISLTGTDDAPVISSGSGSVIEDTDPTVTGQLTATDADNPNLAFNAATTAGVYGELTVDENGAWSFTAGTGADQLAEGEVQTETYTVSLNDGSQTTVQITITGTDDAPVVSSAVAAVTEDTNPTATGTLTASDADNPNLEFNAASIAGSYGDLTVDANGNWSYSLNNNAQALGGGEQAQDVITVTLNDGTTTTVTVNVTGTEDAPVVSVGVGVATEGTVPNVSGTLSVTDVDSPDLLFVDTTIAGNYGDLTVNADGTWNYILNPAAQALVDGEVQTEVFTVLLTDGTATTVTIDVNGADGVPVISTGVGAVVEDITTSVGGTLTATDENNASVLFNAGIQNGVYGDLTIDSNGVWNYQLNANADVLAGGEQQNEVFTVTVADGSATTINITVTGTDDAPVISAGVGVAVEGVTPTATGQLTATDLDNNDLVFVDGTVEGTYGTLTVGTDGTWSYTLNAQAEALGGGETDNDILTVTLSDGSTTTVNIAVTGTDDAPVISTGVGLVVEDVTPTVSGNLTATDADNPNLLFVDATLNGTYGDLTIGSDGMWSYALNANAQALGGGDSENELFTVTLTDGSTTTIQVTVQGTDDLPSVTVGVGAAIENVTTSVSGQLLASDVDNPALEFTAGVQNGVYGDLTVDANGVWNYQLNANAEALQGGEQQTEVFSVSLNDGTTTSVEITVTGTDDLPVVTTGVGAVIEDLSPTVSGTLSATDADNPALLFVDTTVNGTYGDLTIGTNGAWDYTLNANAQALQGGETGNEILTVQLSDGTTTSIQITITGTDDLPVITAGAGVTFEDSQPSISGNLSATDADNADLAFVDATFVGSEGTLTIDPSGAWVYNLDASAQSLALGEVVTETFNVTLTDGSITPIVITVNGENDIPIISSATTSITEGVELSAGGELTYTDVDSLDVHTFVAENLVGTLGSLSIDTNGNWLFTPSAAVESLAAGEVQSEVFTVSLSDGTQSTIQLDITGTDSLPVISSGAGAVVESVTPSISGTLTATDADNADLLFLNATVNGDYGLLTISSNGAWNYELDARADALAAGETQTEILTVQLNDGSTTDVTISVTGTDSVPVISTGTGALVEDVLSTVTGTLTATDADNPALAFVGGVYNGAYGDVSIDAGGAWTYTVNAAIQNLSEGQSVTDSIAIDLNDGSTALIEVAVTGTNDIPVITPVLETFIEGGLAINGNIDVVDADIADVNVFVPTTLNGSYGILTVDALGGWTYTPTTAIEGLADGESFTENFLVTLTDGTTGNVQVDVTGTNDIPVVTPVLATIIEDGLNVTGQVDVIDADLTDVNLFVPNTLNGTYGTLTIDALGNYVYAPVAAMQGLAEGETATDSFIVSLTDGTTGTIDVGITGTNDIPVVTPVLAALTEGGLSVAGQVNVVDLDLLDVNAFVPANLNGTYGNLTLDALGNYVYTPTSAIEALIDGQAATELFTVELTDGTQSTITVNLTGTDTAPIISSATSALTEGTLNVTGQLTATDADNPILAFDAATLTGSYGSLVVDVLGNWTYTPSSLIETLSLGQQETELFTVSLNDGSTTTVQVDLTGTDTLPTISSAAATAVESVVPTVTGLLTATDPDGAAPTFVAATIPGLYGDLTVDASGLWSYATNSGADSLAVGAIGNDAFVVNLSDGSTTTVAVAVTGTDDVPVISTGSGTIHEDASAAIAGVLTATDPDNPGLAFEAGTTAGLFGDFTVDSSGNWSYSVNPIANNLNSGDIGKEVFQVRLNDGSITQVEVDVTGAYDFSLLGGVFSLLGVAVDGLSSITTSLLGEITDALFNVAGQAADPGPLLYVATEIDGDYGRLIVDATGAYNFIARSAADITDGTVVQQVFTLPMSDGSFTTLQLDITGTTGLPVISQAVGTLQEDVLPSLTGEIAVGGTSLASAGTVVSGTYGDLTLGANSTYNLTLTAAAQALGAGEQVTETFDVPLADGSTVALVVNILGQDDAPVIDVQTGSAAEDSISSVTGQLQAYDVDNPDLSFIAQTVSGAYGDLIIDELGNWVYNLNDGAQALSEGETQFDVITVKLTDGNDTTVTIGVTGAADAPIAIEASVATDDATPYTFGLVDFPYTDVEGDTLLAVKVTALPTDGELQLNGSAVVLGQEIPVADITAGNLAYIPNSGITASVVDTIQVQLSDDGINFGNIVPLNVNVTPTVVTATQTTKTTKQMAVAMDEQQVEGTESGAEAIYSVNANLSENLKVTGSTSQAIDSSTANLFNETEVAGYGSVFNIPDLDGLANINDVKIYEVSAQLLPPASNELTNGLDASAHKQAIIFGALGPNDFFSAELNEVSGTSNNQNLNIVKVSGGQSEVLAELQPFEYLRAPADSLNIKVNGDTGTIIATAGLAQVVANLENVPALKNVGLFTDNQPVADVFGGVSVQEFNAYEYQLTVEPNVSSDITLGDLDVVVKGIPIAAEVQAGQLSSSGELQLNGEQAQSVRFESQHRIDNLEVQTSVTNSAELNSSTKIISLVNTDKPVTAIDEVEVFKLLAHSDMEVNSFTLENFDGSTGLDGALEQLDLTDLLPDAAISEQDPLSNYLSVSVEGQDTKIAVDSNQDGNVESEITLAGVDLLGMYGGNDDVVKTLLDQSIVKDS